MLPATSLAAETNAHTSANISSIDSQQIEQDLQRLPWKQFRSVIEAVPKMKASVDAYGPLGWQYVQANYTTYRWKKNIDKLDETQRRQLIDLIELSKSGK